MSRVLGTTLALVFGLLLVSGCEKGSLIHDVEVSNEPGDFSFRIIGMENFTRTVAYSWENADSVASVTQASTIEEGVALVEIRDEVGLLIHARNLREHGTFLTFAGSPGTWKITLILDEATGAAALDVKSHAVQP